MMNELLQQIGRNLVSRKKLSENEWKKVQDTFCNETLALEEELLAVANDKNLYNLILSEISGVGVLDPLLCNIQEEFISKMLELVPKSEWEKYFAFPILQEENVIHISFGNPTEKKTIIKFQELTGCKVKPNICCYSSILQAHRKFFIKEKEIILPETLDEAAEKVLKTVNLYKNKINNKSEDSLSFLMREVSVLKFMKMLFSYFLKTNLSDIHFEPLEDCFQIRIRCDGILQTVGKYPATLAYPVINRLKLMAGLDLENNEFPQDGRFQYDISSEKNIDSRVSCLPSIFGEKIVVRLLDKSKSLPKISELGFQPQNFLKLIKAIEAPHGLVLVTGPTGSGKTSTLNACLNHVNNNKVSIFTVEDPVEYQLKGATQISVDDLSNRSFAAVLRSLLRQDPDIIMVGEIRDNETADIAVKAALTGHLVFSTLHTNNAASSVTRLINMGVEPFIVASSISLIIAQRLIRKICPECKTKTAPDINLLNRLGIKPENLGQVYHGSGCEKCNGTGYQGRIAVAEFLVPDNNIRQLIIEQASAEIINKAAQKIGMKTLREAVVEKVKKGDTTIEEIVRVS